MYQKNSIAAIATGSGSGGLGVIRISGARAKDILGKVFLPKHEANFSFRPRYMHYGSFVIRNIVSQSASFLDYDLANNLTGNLAENSVNNLAEDLAENSVNNISENFVDDLTEAHRGDNALDDIILDEVLAVYFPAPYSYTGEDVAEIHAHGSSVLLHSMLEHIIGLGIEHAEAGEFTKRAFLNGRIDLAQAEAVAEIIAAPAIEGVRLAAAKLHGVLGKKIEDLRTQIEYIRRRICLAIDFPEEEGECLPPQEFHALVDRLHGDIAKLISAYERAKPWSEGCLVVLAGQVNAGKSSLMNAILGRERAIVTAEAGTTRDYLEEASSLAGIPIRLTDTAGLREIAWLIQNSSQEDCGLSPHILERLSHVLHADMPYFGSHGKNIYQENLKDENRDLDDKENVHVGNFENVCVGNMHAENSENKYDGNKYACNAENKSAENLPKNISLIEAEGIRRSLELMERADLVFLVFDGSKLLEQLKSTSSNLKNPNEFKNELGNELENELENDLERVRIIARAMQSELALLPQEVKRICIWNKADIAPLSVSMVNALEKLMNVAIFCISAHQKSNANKIVPFGNSPVEIPPMEILQAENGNPLAENKILPVEIPQAESKNSLEGDAISQIQSIDDLAKFARGILLKQDSVSDEIAPNRRQAGLLQSARMELDFLKEEIDILPPDLTAIRLESCAQYLSSITGLCNVDDTFNAIFAEFCIGK